MNRCEEEAVLDFRFPLFWAVEVVFNKAARMLSISTVSLFIP
jgi:hypothetical protein